MNCILFGHRNAPSSLRAELKAEILKLIDERGVNRFYIGNNGNFDYLGQCVLREIVHARANVNFYIVLSFMGEIALSGEETVTIYPEGLETVPPKFAICKRNEWLVKNGAFAIVYVESKISNCYKLMCRAARRGVHITNLAMKGATSHSKIAGAIKEKDK